MSDRRDGLDRATQPQHHIQEARFCSQGVDLFLRGCWRLLTRAVLRSLVPDIQHSHSQTAVFAPANRRSCQGLSASAQQRCRRALNCAQNTKSSEHGVHHSHHSDIITILASCNLVFSRIYLKAVSQQFLEQLHIRSLQGFVRATSDGFPVWLRRPAAHPRGGRQQNPKSGSSGGGEGPNPEGGGGGCDGKGPNPESGGGGCDGAEPAAAGLPARSRLWTGAASFSLRFFFFLFCSAAQFGWETESLCSWTLPPLVRFSPRASL